MLALLLSMEWMDSPVSTKLHRQNEYVFSFLKFSQFCYCREVLSIFDEGKLFDKFNFLSNVCGVRNSVLRAPVELTMYCSYMYAITQRIGRYAVLAIIPGIAVIKYFFKFKSNTCITAGTVVHRSKVYGLHQDFLANLFKSSKFLNIIHRNIGIGIHIIPYSHRQFYRIKGYCRYKWLYVTVNSVRSFLTKY